MNLYKYATLLIIIFANISCSDSVTGPNIQNEIFGTWIAEDYTDGVEILNKSNTLKKDKYGFTIKPDGIFIERKNSGWCGTPPISYSNFNGTWESKKENFLNIEVGYWGGTTNYDLEIVSISSNKLKIKRYYKD